MRQFSHLDIHDASIGQILIAAGGNVRVTFDHICVYFQVAEETFEVWSARGALQLEGVNTIEVRRAFQSDDYVSEGALLDERGAEIVELRAEDLMHAKRLDLLLAGSGSELHISMERASFVLDSLLQRLEDWHGPLLSQP
jgi:hypothetical protein